MIICGSLNKNTALNSCLSTLNKDPSVVILTETTSNLYDQKFISCIDRTLERINDSSYYPDLVVSIGNSIISKKIKTLLRKINHCNIGMLKIPIELKMFFQL